MRTTQRQLRLKRRPPVCQDRIVDAIRKQILSGQLQPGDRVPDRIRLKQRFKVSTLTVQRAFDRLLADGFVEVRPRHGTFVAAHPPHRHHYALAIPHDWPEPGQNWNKFWTTLVRVARYYNRPDCRISIYTGIDTHLNTHDYRLLLHDVTEKRLGGIIFASTPFLVQDTPLLDEPGLPRVAFMTPGPKYRIPALHIAPVMKFVDRAFSYLVRQGRRRLALIGSTQMKQDQMKAVQDWLLGHDLPFRESWIQAGDLNHPEWTVNLTRLLLDGPPETRPDGLVVADDNLAEPVCEGIRLSACRIPADLDAVMHSNFPLAKPLPLPVCHLGYDLRQLFAQALNLLTRQHHGETCPPDFELTPLFADELTPPVMNGAKPGS